MLINEERPRKAVRRVSCRLTAEVAFQQNSVQELAIQLSFLEDRHAGQRSGWYLQSCKLKQCGQPRSERDIRSVTLRHVNVSFFNTGNHDRGGMENRRRVRASSDHLRARHMIRRLEPYLGLIEAAILAAWQRSLNERDIGSSIARVVNQLDLSPVPAHSRGTVLPFASRRR
jgi:hypothetical protein